MPKRWTGRSAGKPAAFPTSLEDRAATCNGASATSSGRLEPWWWDTEFDWEGDAPLGIPLHRSVIYETHVRGLTMRHPQVPEALRGTYAGLAHPAVIAYLKDLGITAVELMPVHAFVVEKHLLDRGLGNYWGYSSIGFFAPHTRYRSGTEVGSEVGSSRAW